MACTWSSHLDPKKLSNLESANQTVDDYDEAKCAFGVPFGKLLGFIISRRGIELDPSKVKSIRELSPPKNKTEVMSFLGRLNYISRFIAQLSTTCEPIFKLLKKDAAIQWTDECQESFDKIKEYLANPP
ncbi:uncharacterized mitochondrial protein AtMg00860-like, partial [Capsicum annuum]|uniref:uncharacterized mitochondrial protein AtMg00860-like n=1 Tax=Capsicum annuum TaxID=4072 RepID=UPI001FB0EBCC